MSYKINHLFNEWVQNQKNANDLMNTFIKFYQKWRIIGHLSVES